jgi:hypothetical protein
MTDTDATYAVFLGADMAPDNIERRSDMADGDFAGIGAIATLDLAGLGLPLPPVDEVWGVVMRLPGTLLDGPKVPVALRTGEQVDATVLTTPGDLDLLDTVLAQARNRELPAAYRDALEALANG